MNKILLFILLQLFIFSFSQTTINIFNNGNNGCSDNGCSHHNNQMTDVQRYRIYEKVIQNILDSAVWPTGPRYALALEGIQPNQTIIDNINTIFETNVSGRITPFGDFIGIDGVSEYFFSLPNPLGLPNEPTDRLRLMKTEFKNFLAQGTLVSTRIAAYWYHPTDLNTPRTIIFFDGFWTFSSNNKIISFDLNLYNVGRSLLFPDIPISTLIGTVCQVSTYFCTGQNQVYANSTDCVNFLSSITPGNYFVMNTNTVTCRYLHSKLAVANPHTHCPHIGKTGGGKCVDEHTYDQFVTRTSELTKSNWPAY